MSKSKANVAASKSNAAKEVKAPRVRKPAAPKVEKLHPEVKAAEATMPAAVLATKPDAPAPDASKRTIEKDRPEQNGVKQPLSLIHI